MRTGNKIREIADWLSHICTKIQILSSLNMHDCNIDAERVFGRILSHVLNCSLVDLNQGHKNHPAVDLGDRQAGIAVQVTSDTTAGKVKRTLDGFFENNLDKIYYDRLLILVIAEEVNYRKIFSPRDGYDFDQRRDIWDLKRLISEISILDDDRIDQIYRYLKYEMDHLETIWKYPEEKQKHLVIKIVGELEDMKEQTSQEPKHTNNESEKRSQEKRQPEKPVSKEKKQKEETEKHPLAGALAAASLLVVIGIIIALTCGAFSPEPEMPSINPYYPNQFIDKISSYLDLPIQLTKLTMYHEVDAVLANAGLENTSVPISYYNVELNDSDDILSFQEESVSFPFAMQCAMRDVNPIAAFFATVNSGLYEKKSVEFDSFAVELDDPRYLNKFDYHVLLFNGESEKRNNYGADTLLHDILTLSSKGEDDLDIEKRILNKVSANGLPIVMDSWADHCYYNYYVYYGENTAHILCVYMRTDNERERLTDVEFQLLNLRYCAGKPLRGDESLQEIDNRNSAQAASLIIAIENLLAGESAYDRYLTSGETAAGNVELVIPTVYSLGDYQVSITQTCYESAALGEDENGNCVEQGTLVTYRIHK